MGRRSFRQLSTADVPEFAEIMHQAYPTRGFTPESKDGLTRWATNAIEKWPPNDLWGIFLGESLAAAMGTLRFETNVRGALIPTWGAHMVGVGLPFKRQGLAHELIHHYLVEARRQGFTLASLYPFRVDFYKKMGFGHATQWHQYRIKAASFPSGGGTEHLVQLTPTAEDRAGVLACYNRFLAKTHGAVSKLDPSMWGWINPNTRVIAYRPGDQIQGYLVYKFDLTNSPKYDLEVAELVWETPAALGALLTFLHNQQDQAERVMINTPEDQLHLLVSDPGNGHVGAYESDRIQLSVTGVGAQFRVIDLPGLMRLLEGRRIGYGTCTAQINLRDDFLAENQGQTLIRVEEGVVVPAGDRRPDVELTIGVGEFSSLLMGGVDLFTLHRYGLASLTDDEQLARLAGMFAAPYRPIFSLYF